LIASKSNKGLLAQLLRGGAGSALVQAANGFVALALSVVLARALGTEGYGLYAYAFSIMGLLMALAEMGFPTLLIREVAASKSRSDWRLLRGAVVRSSQFVLITATVVSVVGLLILNAFDDSLSLVEKQTWLYMLMLLPLAALTKIIASALKGLYLVVAGQTLEALLRPVLVLVGLMVLFYTMPTLRQPHYAMGAQLLAGAITMAVAMLVIRRQMPKAVWNATPQYQNLAWLKSAIPFTLISGAGIINNQADIIMLGGLRQVDDVGVYRVAMQVAMLVMFWLQAIGAFVTPHFARLYAQSDMEGLQRLATMSARVILFGALPAAMILGFAGEWLLGLVYGQEYLASFAPLLVLVLGQLLATFFGAVGPLLSMAGLERTIANSMWASVISNIVLNFTLIPIYGATGAALATSMTLVGWTFFLYLLSKRRLGIVCRAI